MRIVLTHPYPATLKPFGNDSDPVSGALSMKATRAYIASLGTTGVLIGSSVLILVVVSALVAFRGWPGDGLNGLGVLGDDEPSLELSGPAVLAADAAPAAAAVAVAPAPGTAAAVAPTTASGTTPDTTPGAPSTGDTLTPPTGTAPGSAPAGGGGATGGGGGGGGDAVGGLTNDTADATEQTTRQLGDTVGGVNEQVGQGLSDTGETVSDVVRGLDDGLPR